MKKLITSGFLFILAISGVAQEHTDTLYKRSLAHSPVADRISVSVFMGAAMASTNFKSGPVTSGTYIAPLIGYRLTEKFKLNVGVIHYMVNGNSYLPITLGENKFPTGRQQYSGNLFMLEGQYKLNDQLMLSGDLMYDASPLLNKQRSFKAASLALDYKVSEHTTLSIKTMIIQNNGYNSPYSNAPFGSGSLPPMGMRPTLFNTYPTNVSPANF
jgi:hypothetical protein